MPLSNSECLSRFSSSRVSKNRCSATRRSIALRALASLIGAASGALFLALSSMNVSAAPPGHENWTDLLQDCVIASDDGHSTAADYDCFSTREAELDAYLEQLSSIAKPDFESWEQQRRLAFLINAYNAWTVKLILSAWPELDSIRDLGSLFRSPWKQEFIPLLGEERSLDDIEHGMIREPGRYDDPRIHFAVNCASIGCPALRREAFTGAQLDVQLDEQTRQFLGDRSRNRFASGRLELSPLFKWYREDFEAGWRGHDTLASFLGRYSEALGANTEQSDRWANNPPAISFLDYDWNLNSAKN